MTQVASADKAMGFSADRVSALPDWYPAWAHQLAEEYYSATTSMFLLHGNVRDLVRCVAPAAAGRPSFPDSVDRQYTGLLEFLGTQVFGRWDIVLSYDLGRGLRPVAGADEQRHRAMMQHLAARLGDPASWPRDPDRVLVALDGFLERTLLDPPPSRKSVALVFDYAQYLLPAGGLESLTRGNAARLVQFLHWAQNPHIKRVNMAFCLIADRMAEVNERLVESLHVGTIEVPLPDRQERRRFLECLLPPDELARRTAFTLDQLADVSNGLGLVDLQVLVSQATADRPLDARRFGALKKEMIERQCRGLVEFIEPQHSLDMVVGYAEAKRRLREDAQRLSRGQFETAPMGYLICGPVGTGKTFLAECYAGTIGIPCLVLRNFRSKYVGETEANLQQVLSVLRALGPVVVIVDEADAALGNRQTEGDSGTSARVFSMIASQMGNTRYRGKIVWMLLTSRPDLLPIDLKRQGRAEVHIPLLYPREEADIRAMFEAMARKNRVPLLADAIPPVSAERRLTGADIESIVLAAHREALSAGRQEVTRADLEKALAEFLPSAEGLEKELQELAAVLECTQLSFLPEPWRTRLAEPEARSRLQERLMALRQLLEH